jgi:GNAT superfamily N-acetyltransferase
VDLRIVESAELAQRRTQMGRSIQAWVLANGPRAVGRMASGYWLVLTASPGPDGNMALVHDGDPSTLQIVKDKLEAIGYPTLLLLAGYPTGRSIGPRWDYEGRVPFMTLDLGKASLRPDARVRQATAADFETVVQLVSEANPFGPEVAAVGATFLREQVDSPVIWLLYDDEVPVSAVSAAVVDDAVCIWSMATPSRYSRRGYGRAVLSHALYEAYSQGDVATGLLAASPAGRPLYQATGWSELEQWDAFVTAGTACINGASAGPP